MHRPASVSVHGSNFRPSGDFDPGGQTGKMNTAASLIAVSLLLLIAVAVAALFLAGGDSRSSNEDDPPPG